MKALVRDRYGSADALRVAEVPVPRLGDGDVLVRVRATSVNGTDAEHLRGDPIVRMSGPFRPSVKVLGSDIAGTIEAIGPAVTRFAPGDEVFGDLFGDGRGVFGGFAELARAPQRVLMPKPGTLTFEDASTLPQAAVLALQGLRDREPVQPGQQVLVNGAGGGVGTFAVQIAKSLGADVSGVDSARKLDMLRTIGADDVIDYAEQDFTRNGRRYDRIIDVQSHRSPSDYRRALSPDGTCFLIGGSMARILQAFLAGQLLSKTSQQWIGLLAWRQYDETDLGDLVDLVLAGTETPVIDTVYPLAEGAEAMRRTAAGEVLGKVVIAI